MCGDRAGPVMVMMMVLCVVTGCVELVEMGTRIVVLTDGADLPRTTMLPNEVHIQHYRYDDDDDDDGLSVMKIL